MTTWHGVEMTIYDNGSVVFQTAEKVCENRPESEYRIQSNSDYYIDWFPTSS